MRLVLHLIIIDKSTHEMWITPFHDDNEKKDDFHREVKVAIMKRISGKLKKRFGKNCNIDIEQGKIVIHSQVVDERTGRKTNKRHTTEISAEDHFNRVTKYLISFLITDWDNLEISIIKVSEQGRGRVNIKMFKNDPPKIVS